jgi:hypothetical protein
MASGGVDGVALGGVGSRGGLRGGMGGECVSVMSVGTSAVVESVGLLVVAVVDVVPSAVVAVPLF